MSLTPDEYLDKLNNLRAKVKANKELVYTYERVLMIQRLEREIKEVKLSMFKVILGDIP